MQLLAVMSFHLWPEHGAGIFLDDGDAKIVFVGKGAGSVSSSSWYMQDHLFSKASFVTVSLSRALSVPSRGFTGRGNIEGGLGFLKLMLIR